MNEERQDNKTRNYMLMRTVMDYGMGIIILGFGAFFAFSHKFGVDFTIDPFFRYMFSGLCVLYGGFRIFRGYQKNYFNND